MHIFVLNNKYKEEIEIKKIKLSQFEKLQETLEFYKSKYETHTKIIENIKSEQKLSSQLKKELNELEKRSNFQSTKIQKYKEKNSQAQSKIFDLEREVSKKINEIELLKKEKRDLDQRISNLEEEVAKKKVIDGSIVKRSTFIIESSHDLEKEFKDLKDMKGSFRESEEKITSFENEDYDEVQEVEIEILEKKYEIVIEKMKKLESENYILYLENQKYKSFNKNLKSDQCIIQMIQMDNMEKEKDKGQEYEKERSQENENDAVYYNYNNCFIFKGFI